MERKRFGIHRRYEEAYGRIVKPSLELLIKFID